MRWIPTSAVFALIAAACSPAAQSQPPTTTQPAATTTTTTASSEICLSGDLPFDNDGLVAALGEDTGDATSLTQIRWDPSSNCERVTIVFGTASGAPASTLGPSGVSVISFAGIVRVVLPPQVDASAIADTLIEGSLVETVYVVRDAEGTMFVDIHGVDEVPLAARAFTTTSPATLIVDIVRSDTPAVPVGVTSTPSVIIVSPTPGSSSYPIVVEGYVEPGLLAVHVRLTVSDVAIVDRSVSVGGWKDTWQLLSTIIDDGTTGTAVLYVGTLDTNDEPLEGARVSITIEQP